MTNRIAEDSRISVPEQAAQWLLRWHCGDLSVADRFAYLQWLKTSSVHIAEMLRMCRLYTWLESTNLKLFVTDPFEVKLERAVRSYPVDTETLVRDALEELARRRRARWPQWMRKFTSPRWAAAAAIALAMVAVILVWLMR
ncbi:MAG: FecR/PupR family sigma factor regulator [Steroidobacteraceae bacterium]